MAKVILLYCCLFQLHFFSVASTPSEEQYTVLQKGFWSSLINGSFDSLDFGYHLKCCCYEMPGVFHAIRDTSGRTVATTGAGAGLLDWLSNKYHFTYECITENPNHIENIGSSLGTIHYIETGACEMIVSPVVIRYDRFLHFDFLHPFIQTPYAMLIPAPEVSITNIEAVWKPFQPNIWITLFAFIVLTTATLVLLNINKRGRQLDRELNSYGMFVVQTIVSQSASVPSDGRMLKIRLVMGAWCLVSLWMTTAYSSVLVSFIMAPHYQPLVDTLEDLAFKNDVYPLVIKNKAADVTISNSRDPLMKKIAEKLNRNPSHNRCPNILACVQQVKHGSYAFINGLEQIGIAAQEDFTRTRKCNFAYAKETFLSSYYAWGIQKKHHLRESINRGILRTLETGLVETWTKRNLPVLDKQCNSFRDQASRPATENNRPPRLNLNNLMGPFIILLFGSITALFVFVSEQMTYCIWKRR